MTGRPTIATVFQALAALPDLPTSLRTKALRIAEATRTPRFRARLDREHTRRARAATRANFSRLAGAADAVGHLLAVGIGRLIVRAVSSPGAVSAGGDGATCSTAAQPGDADDDSAQRSQRRAERLTLIENRIEAALERRGGTARVFLLDKTGRATPCGTAERNRTGEATGKAVDLSEATGGEIIVRFADGGAALFPESPSDGNSEPPAGEAGGDEGQDAGLIQLDSTTKTRTAQGLAPDRQAADKMLGDLLRLGLPCRLFTRPEKGRGPTLSNLSGAGVGRVLGANAEGAAAGVLVHTVKPTAELGRPVKSDDLEPLALWLDFDRAQPNGAPWDADSINARLPRGLKAALVLETSPGRSHALLAPRIEGLDAASYKAAARALAGRFDGAADPTDSPTKTLRLAGSINSKDPDKLHLVRCVHRDIKHIDPLPAGRLLGILNVKPQAPEKPRETVTPAPITPARQAYSKGALQRACEAVRQAPRGTRSDTLTRAARGLGNLIAAGTLDKPEALAALLDAAKDDGLPEAEALDVARRGLAAGEATPRDLRDVGQAERSDKPQGGGAEAKAAPPARPLLAWGDGCAAWLDSEPAPVSWIFRDVLAEGTVGIVTGAGGCGKSFLTLQLAEALAAGVPFEGFVPDMPRRVLVLNAEDGTGKLHHRLRATSAALGLTDNPRLRDDLRIEPLVGDAPLLVTTDARGNFATGPGFDWLDASLAGLNVGLVILDTKSRFFNFDENDNAGAAFAIMALERLARRHGCAFLLVAHESKAAVKESLAEASGRGAGALRDCARLHIACARISAKQAADFGVDRRDFMAARIVKSNDGREDDADRYFRRIEGGALLPANLRLERFDRAAELIADALDESPMTRRDVERGSKGAAIRSTLAAETGVKVREVPAAVDAALRLGIVRTEARETGSRRAKGQYLIAADTSR